MYDLRSVILLRDLFFAGRSDSTPTPAENQRTVAIAAEILKRLQEVNQAKGSTLVVVFLPTIGNYWGGVPSSVESLHQEAVRAGILWIDLTPDLRTLTQDEVAGLYIPEGQLAYVGAAGHYNAAGSRFVAQRLYQHLTAIPAVAAKLKRAGPTQQVSSPGNLH